MKERITGKEFYELYQNPETRSQAEVYALQLAEPILKSVCADFHIAYSDEEDAKQESRIAVLESLKIYDSDKSELKTWISKYIKCAIYNYSYYARYGTTKYLHEQYGAAEYCLSYIETDEHEGYDDFFTRQPSPENVEENCIQKVELDDIAEELHKKIAKLPEKQQQIIKEKYFSGKEIKMNRKYQYYHAEALKNLRKEYGIKDYKRSLTCVGSRFDDYRNRKVVVIDYKNCMDITALVKEIAPIKYYLVENVPTGKLKDRDFKHSKVIKWCEISPDMIINDKICAEYF